MGFDIDPIQRLQKLDSLFEWNSNLSLKKNKEKIKLHKTVVEENKTKAYSGQFLEM